MDNNSVKIMEKLFMSYYIFKILGENKVNPTEM